MERKYLYWVNSLESRSDTSDVTDVTTSQQLAVPQSHAAVGPQTLELCSLQSQAQQMQDSWILQRKNSIFDDLRFLKVSLYASET